MGSLGVPVTAKFRTSPASESKPRANFIKDSSSKSRVVTAIRGVPERRVLKLPVILFERYSHATRKLRNDSHRDHLPEIIPFPSAYSSGQPPGFRRHRGGWHAHAAREQVTPS